MTIDPNYLISCMFKTALEDRQYLTTITTVFIPEYFEDATHSEIFKSISEHLLEFKEVPQRDIVIQSVSSSVREDCKNFFTEMDSIDYDTSRNYTWLLENTNIYLKDRAIKRAIMDSADIIDSGGNVNEIKSLVEAALCKDIKINLGLDYWGKLFERLKDTFSATDIRIPTYLPQLDEYLNGGFPPYTFSAFIGKIHSGKSNIMANIITRQVMHGHNVGICTLEMSEKAFAQRFDSIYSMLDINRMYTNNQMKRDLYSALKTLKKQEGRGDLYIKEFPTGTASTANFRIWLRELAMRGKAPEILYCDYVNLMKPEYGSKDSMYGDVKKISEELRAIGFEFNIPVVSVSQLNRSGSFLTLEEVDMNSISESSGLGATADFVAILGSDEDAMVYESEVAYKICKSRFGHSGIINRLYLDDRSLKLYDVSEMDLWIEDSKRSGGSTNIYNKG